MIELKQSKISLNQSQYKTFNYSLNLPIFIYVLFRDLNKIIALLTFMLKNILPSSVGNNKVKKTYSKSGNKMIQKLAINQKIEKLFKSKNSDKNY